MSQKIQPLSYRSTHFFENLIFLQQFYVKVYSSYFLFEQFFVLNFIKKFFLFIDLEKFTIKLHSLKLLKVAFSHQFFIKYILFKKNKNFLSKDKSFYFSSIEQAFFFGFNKNVKKKHFSLVSFFNLTKRKKILNNSIKTFFFSPLTLSFFLKTLLFFKGASFFLVEIISQTLKKMRSKIQKKRQKEFVEFIKSLFYYLFKFNSVGINGLKFSLKGRLNGALRKKKYHFSFGKVPLGKINAKINFSALQSETPYGTIGIKFWIYYRI